MCGIAGIYSVTSPPALAEIERMTATLVHRGPDGCGHFVDGKVALGHRRLSVLDRERGAQPMTSQDGNLVITFNGTIYNFRELRDRLAGDGVKFRTSGDTEVLLAMYARYGPELLGHLSGMFAFAIWDRRAQRLLLAGDRLGIKPLYLAEAGGRLYFGSEIAALRSATPEFDEIDQESVNSYFSRQYIGGTGTIFRGILKLPPATVLELGPDGRRQRTYWSLATARPTSTTDITQAALELDHRLQQVVAAHLVSDVPIGVFLSGGIDSSALVAYAAAAGGHLQTFSVGFSSEPRHDETEHARFVARTFSTEHHEIRLSATDAIAALPAMIAGLDQPRADYALLPTYLMSRFAAERVKVVLSGEGGDELFGGYRRYRRYALLDRIPGGDLLRDLLPGPPLFHDATRRRLLPELFIARDRLPAEAKLLADKRRMRPTGHVNSMLYTDLSNWLVDNLLAKVDRMAMLASLEARVPFLDHEMVEFAMALDGRLKVGPRRGKLVLLEAVRRRLPAATIARRKQGFTVPVGDWLRGPLSAIFNEVVLDPAQHHVDRAYVATLTRAGRAGAPVGFKLWSILIFCWWLRAHR